MAQKGSLAAYEKQKQALSLALAGVDYQTIAERVGYNSRQAAWKAVKSALNKTIRADAEKVKEVQLLRLDKMLFAIWNNVIKGDLKAIDRAVKIEERRSHLLGTDAPAKNYNIDLDNLTPEELERIANGEDPARVLKRNSTASGS